MSTIANIARAINGYTDTSNRLADRRYILGQRNKQAQDVENRRKINASIASLFSGTGQQPYAQDQLSLATQAINPNIQSGLQAGSQIGISPDGSENQLSSVLGLSPIPQISAWDQMMEKVSPQVQQKRKLIDPFTVKNELMGQFNQAKNKLRQYLSAGEIDVGTYDQWSKRIDSGIAGELNHRLGGDVSGFMKTLNTSIYQNGGNSKESRQLAKSFIKRNPFLENYIDPDAEDFAEQVKYLQSFSGGNADILKAKINAAEEANIDDHNTSNDLAIAQYKSQEEQNLANLKYRNSVDLENLRHENGSILSAEDILRQQKLAQEVKKLENTNEQSSIDKKEDFRRQVNLAKDTSSTIKNNISNIDSAMKLANENMSDELYEPTVMDVALAKVPGTGEYRLAETIESVKANIGFDKLMQMKASSKTGGALGQVSERELAQLERTIASLNMGLGKSKLLENLGKVKSEYSRILQKIDQDKKRLGVKNDGDDRKFPKKYEVLSED